MSGLMKNNQGLPEGWNIVTLNNICEINPRLDKLKFPANMEVSFVPMAAVGASDGKIDVSQKRPFYEVKKGFTSFQSGDVLFAKITPCMENGKMAVVPKLVNECGFGSTEFHVLRPNHGTDAHYIYYYVSCENFRREAAHNMTGAVGQKRVSPSYLSEQKIPLAPLDQQKLIVSEIEKQFSRLDEAVAALKRVRASLKRYKASVLKAAVEGKLTEEWRLSARKRAQVDELESTPKAQTGKWFVYIIECDNQTFYVGHSSDLHARWQAHCDGKAADWTHQHPPKYLIHFEVFNSKEAAVKRENDLKTGFGRTWRKREIAVGRMKPLLHNPNNETALPVHEVLTGDKLLKRILAERKKKWEEKNPGKKYKEPVSPDTSNLPELPKGWVWATVGQLAVKVQYGSSAKTNENPSGVPVLRMGNIFEGRLKREGLKYLPKNHSEFPDLFLEKKDLLFNRTNSPELVGKTAVYMGNPNPCSFASYLIRVQFNNGASSHFVSSFINSAYGRNWIKTVVAQQVGQANVNGTKLQALSIPLPLEKEQKVIVEEIENRLSVAEEIEEAIDINLKRAERLRQAILKKAFSGRLVLQISGDESASMVMEGVKR